MRNAPCVSVFKSGLSTGFFDGSISCAQFDLVFEAMLSGPSAHDSYKAAIVVLVFRPIEGPGDGWEHARQRTAKYILSGWLTDIRV